MGMRGGAHGRLAPRWKRPPSRRRGLRALCRASAGRRESAASILFTCGGTGGHVYPAVAVADRLRSLVPDLAIDFVGSRDRIEWDVVPKSGYAVRSVPCAPIHRPLSSWRNVRSVLVQFLGLLKALWLLVRKRPRAGKNRFRWRCNRVRLALERDTDGFDRTTSNAGTLYFQRNKLSAPGAMSQFPPAAHLGF